MPPYFLPPPNPPTITVAVAAAEPRARALPAFIAASAALSQPAAVPAKAPSANFRVALMRTLHWEGGYVAVDVKPSVGETNYGITAPVARAHGYRGPMRAIPLSVVEAIYARSYWLPQFEDLPLEVAVKVFDTGVNTGPAQAVRFLQRALGVNDTGKFDAATVAAAAKLTSTDVPAVMQSLRTQQKGFYAGLIAKDAALERYRTGWMRRAAS